MAHHQTRQLLQLEQRLRHPVKQTRASELANKKKKKKEDVVP
jgi:hypothetical protein